MNKNLEYISEKNKDLISFLSLFINYHYKNTLLLRKNDSLMFNFFLNEFISKDLEKKCLLRYFKKISMDMDLSKKQFITVTAIDNSDQFWFFNFNEGGSLTLNYCYKDLDGAIIIHQQESSVLSIRNITHFVEYDLGKSLLDKDDYELLFLKFDMKNDLLKIENFYFKDMEVLNEVRGFYE